jgi:hypothetical protein
MWGHKKMNFKDGFFTIINHGSVSKTIWFIYCLSTAVNAEILRHRT